MRDKKKNATHMGILSMCILSAFLASQVAFGQTLSTDSTTEDTSTTDDASTTLSVKVYPRLINTYCESGVGKGDVTITEDPSLGLTYEIEGAGSVQTINSGGTAVLVSGEYYWRIVSDSSLSGIEPTEGKILIDDMCQTDTTTNDTTTSNTTTEEPPLPPQSFDVLRESGITFVLIDAGENVTDNLYAFRIYRQCEDSTWWSVAKLRIEECGGYTCSYQVTDKTSGDTCQYAISSMSATGLESARTVSKTPTVSQEDTNTTDTTLSNDTSDSTETTATSDTTSESDTDDGVTASVESTADSTDEPLTTKDVTRHTATGKYMILLSTDDASNVEWVMYPDGSDTSTYLGKAIFNKETGFWEYRWDTTQVPNGDYTLVPRISSLSGRMYKDAPTYVRVKNETITTYSEEEQDLIDIVKEAAQEVEKVSNESDAEKEQQAKEDVIKVLEPYAKEVQDYIDKNGEEAVKQELIDAQERIKRELTTLLNIESSKLLRALGGDEEEFKRFQNKIIIASQQSTNNIRRISNEFGLDLSERELVQLELEVKAKLEELEEVIQERREVLKDRVGEKVFEDTDKDGISNYDEVHIYNTDPLNPDTDGDGFFDGAEILGGFNPLSPASEATVTYEQPRTSGFLEEKDFVVKDVEVVKTVRDDSGEERAEKIRFRGKAPANSFVTIYIYSDPIIVTVKTDSEGNWVYELDKELEDGSHEAYVAITDNAGRIFAKSQPLPFIKEAAAVTIDESALFNPQANEAPSFFGSAYVYIIVLLIIAIIGWALVFTGSRQARLENEVR